MAVQLSKPVYAEVLQGRFRERIDDLIRFKYGNPPALAQVAHATGSNPYYVVSANEMFRAADLPLRTIGFEDALILKELEKQGKGLGLTGNYVDISGVLRREKGFNEAQARKLLEQYQGKLPVTIDLTEFDLEEDSSSEGGLVLRLRENARILQGDKGETKGTGAFEGLYLHGRGLYFYSSQGVLQESNSLGRVVLVSGEATQNFDKYTPELKKALRYVTEERTGIAQQELTRIGRFQRIFQELIK